jgi:uncharacterized protein
MPARALALAGIGAYRRYVSPHKGFGCAWRVHRGGASCSLLGLRAVRRHGVQRGLLMLRERLARCADVHRRHHPRGLHAERGSCDAPCDLPCDGSELRGLDGCQCCDCGDWRRRREERPPRQRQREAVSPIPTER